jgi:hypothetical protein
MRLIRKLFAWLFPLPERTQVPVLKHLVRHFQSERGPVLIAQFTGASGYGCSCADTERQIRDIIFAAFEQTRPAALVYDFRALEYRWGDNLTETFYYHPDASIVDDDIVHPEPYVDTIDSFPVVYAVSDLNRTGLTSLLRDEMDIDPSLYMFESIEEALAIASERIPLPASS